MNSHLCKIDENLYQFIKAPTGNPTYVYYTSYGFVDISDHWSSELLILRRVNERNEYEYALFTLYNDGSGMLPNDYYCDDARDDDPYEVPEIKPYVYEDMFLSCDMSDEDGVGFIAARKNGLWGIIQCLLPVGDDRVQKEIVSDFVYPSMDEAISAIEGEFRPKYEWLEPDVPNYFYDDLSPVERMALGIDKVSYSSKIQKKADEGDPVYMIILALCYYHGAGINRDLRKSYEWAMKSDEAGWKNASLNDLCFIFDALMDEDRSYIDERIEDGDSDMMVRLAVCYHLGDKVNHDDKKAKMLLQMAEVLGNPEAGELIEYYFSEDG